ncbi:MAG TPA: hypothetical protein VJ803_05285 [Gemmatimonadaceae bacterium]|nr:hypothetical protein [Gemmatimonadaceae bacterium]
MRSLLRSAAVLVISATAAHAQGTLGVQGFGYPPGQFSARTLGTAGALGETDPASPLNPAALASWGRAAIFLQYSPEFRTVSVPGGESKTTTVRFPLVGTGLPIGERGAIGITASTYLDRSWETEGVDTTVFGSDTVAFNETFQSLGAINDVRVAGAWAFGPSVRVGLAAHLYTGENRLRIARSFSDSAFAGFEQQSTVGYSGSAGSIGIELRPLPVVAIAGSARIGGRLTAERADTTIGRGNVPNRYAGAIQFTGLRGTTIAARVSWEEWSRLRPLTQSNLAVFDAWEYSVGAETRGPTLFGAPIPVRLGYQRRTLPFGAGRTTLTSTEASHEVRETSLSFGVGLPLAQGRALADIALMRASRSGPPGGIEERSWMLSLGLTIRP